MEYSCLPPSRSKYTQENTHGNVQKYSHGLIYNRTLSDEESRPYKYLVKALNFFEVVFGFILSSDKMEPVSLKVTRRRKILSIGSEKLI